MGGNHPGPHTKTPTYGPMNGADSLLETLVACRVEVCFANPGTSEMHFVAALDKQGGMRGVLGLFEGVVTGAADGYARLAGKPACTLLHLGPGLANGLANLHNARRARVPIVNIVGEHATYHRGLDAPLTSHIEGFAEPVSGWVRVSRCATDVAGDGAAAVQASLTPPGQVATLIVPADVAWSEAETVGGPLPAPPPAPGDPEEFDAAVRALASGRPAALLVNGAAASERGLELAGKIAAKTGARLLGDTFITRVARGAGRLDLPRVPYFAEQAEEVLAGLEYLILVGTKAPVTFFAYPGRASELTPEGCEVITLATPEQDSLSALEALVEAVGATRAAVTVRERQDTALPAGPLDPSKVGRALAHFMPEHSILVNEAATCGLSIAGPTAGAAPHDWLDLTGGAIGYGLPCATGAAIACPGRRVFALQADGGGMYTVQALWTHARESLDVTTIVFSNRKYAILQIEFMRLGAENPGPEAMSLTSLDSPDLNWVQLANGMGVPASRATTAEEFNAQLGKAVEASGPYLIEAVL